MGSQGELSAGWGTGNGGKVTGIRGINDRYKIDGEVKNSIRNVETKELVCMTHMHELRGMQGREGEREKKWDNCNSIINEIHLKLSK